MQIDLINHFHRENIETFNATVLKRPWNHLILVTDGEYAIQLQTKQKPLVLKQGDIAFIPTQTEFTRKVLSPVSYYHLAFYSQADHPFYQCVRAGKLTLPEPQRDSIFKSLTYASPLPNNQELIIHIIEHIFVEQYLFGKTKKTALKQFSDEITSTINYMNRNLDKKIDIPNLAARVYLSHSGLIWKFKKELDTTPSEYLNLLRLRYAKQLLSNHSYSVTQIAEMCGYCNPYYFTNLFHKRYGMSPSAFRKFHLNNR